MVKGVVFRTRSAVYWEEVDTHVEFPVAGEGEKFAGVASSKDAAAVILLPHTPMHTIRSVLVRRSMNCLSSAAITIAGGRLIPTMLQCPSKTSAVNYSDQCRARELFEETEVLLSGARNPNAGQRASLFVSCSQALIWPCS